MKPGFSFISLLLALSLAAVAEVPQRAPLTRYQKLWSQSMFTTPVVLTGGPVYNPLEDYVLLGVSGLSDGRVQVTIMNKKQPTLAPICIESGKMQDGMRIKEVIEKKGDPMGTVIRLERGGVDGLVAFDERYLKIAPPVAKPATAQNKPTPPASANPAVIPASPRPRIVQPGNVTAPQNPAGNPGGGIPGVNHSGTGSRFPRRTR